MERLGSSHPGKPGAPLTDPECHSDPPFRSGASFGTTMIRGASGSIDAWERTADRSASDDVPSSCSCGCPGWRTVTACQAHPLPVEGFSSGVPKQPQ